MIYDNYELYWHIITPSYTIYEHSETAATVRMYGIV